MKKILLISHKAERTGAPILLLNLAMLLIKKGWEVHFLVKQGGELVPDFSKAGKTTVLYPDEGNLLQSSITRARAKVVAWRLKRKLVRYSAIISNTITNGDLHYLLQGAKKVYTYVHELATVIDTMTTAEQRRNVLEHTQCFLYPSRPVKEILLKDFGGPPCRWLPYYIPDHLSKKHPARDIMRKQLGLSDDVVVVGGMGFPSGRKGVDLFLSAARNLLARRPDTRFIWCGGSEGSPHWLTFQREIAAAGLKEQICLLPNHPESWKVMSAFDLFFLSSREDAYPLVMLEAAMMKIPVVYFQSGGGADEFLAADAGFPVAYLDIDAAVTQIIELANDLSTAGPAVRLARQRYETIHSEEHVLRRFDSIFQP